MDGGRSHESGPCSRVRTLSFQGHEHEPALSGLDNTMGHDVYAIGTTANTILAFELVGVQEVVVDCAQVTDVV